MNTAGRNAQAISRAIEPVEKGEEVFVSHAILLAKLGYEAATFVRVASGKMSLSRI